MNQHAAETYKRITGVAPPKPWAERTHDERLRARELFFQTVRESSEEDVLAVEEFFRVIRAETPPESSRFLASEEEIA